MILIIDNYDSFTYNLYQGLSQFYSDICVFRNDQISVDQVKQMQPDGIVLSPGPGRAENAGICIKLIEAITSEIPLLGVCLGHQAIINAFSGKITQAPVIVHGKSDLIFHHRKGIYQDLPLPFTAGRYHSLMADSASLPDSLVIEAQNADGLIMGIRHREYPIYGVQFHPESILTPQGSQLLHNFVEQSVSRGGTLCN